MMKVKIATCLMICCNWQLAIGNWIHNKLQWRWQNGCWNVYWWAVDIGEDGVLDSNFEHQNLKLH
jgi:hypothetical protein